MSLVFFIPGLPVPKQSFRIGRRGGGWQPARVTQYQKRVQWAASAAMRDQGWSTAPAGQPVEVLLLLAYPWPQKARKADRDRWAYRTLRPDADNATKGILDALSKAGVWTDDQQVAVLQVTKATVPRGSEGAHLIVEAINDPAIRLHPKFAGLVRGLQEAPQGRGPD